MMGRKESNQTKQTNNLTQAKVYAIVPLPFVSLPDTSWFSLQQELQGCQHIAPFSVVGYPLYW